MISWRSISPVRAAPRSSLFWEPGPAIPGVAFKPSMRGLHYVDWEGDCRHQGSSLPPDWGNTRIVVLTRVRRTPRMSRTIRLGVPIH